MKFKIEVKWIALGFILIGIGLSIIDLLNFRSLWLDEAMLALNIINKPVIELLKPLDYNQVAPIGFLITEKFFTFLFGNTDWALRIFPLISFFIATFLIYLTTYKVLNSKLVGLYTAAFFATSFMMLSYSLEVKQYMTDVALVLVIILNTMNYIEGDFENNWREYAIVGMLSIWFSNIAILFLFSSGIYSIYKIGYTNKEKILCLSKVLGLWFFSFFIYYVLFIHNHPTTGVMVNYWEKLGAFIPQNIFSIEFYKSLLSKIEILSKLLGSLKLSFLLTPIGLLGLLFLGKKKKGVLFLLTFPIVLHLILSYLKLYPFATRLVLYSYPLLLIIIFSGFYFLFSVFIKNPQKLPYILSILLVVNSIVLWSNGFPVEKEEIKKSMAYMNSKLTKGDNLYIYYKAQPAFNFYKKQFNFKIDSTEIILASRNRNNWINHKEPILKLNNSVWLLFSHSYWVKNENNMTEEEFILNILTDEGYQIRDEQKYTGSSIYHAVRKMPTPNNVYTK